MKKLIIIAALASCATESGSPGSDAGSGQTCSIDLDTLCGERPSAEVYSSSLSRFGSPEFTAADLEVIQFYGDRMTAWSSCAVALTTEIKP